MSKKRDEYHILKPARPIDLEYVQRLSEDKRLALLSILTHTDFEECPNFRSQIAFVRDALEQNGRVDITHRELGGVFGCHHHSIQKQLQKIAGTVKANGRPNLLSPEARQRIVQMVTKAYGWNEPVTIDEILDELETKFNISLSSDTLWHIIQRMPEIKVVTGIPMEKERIMVRLEVLQDYAKRLKAMIEGIPREFVVNMDETGCADFVDAREQKVLVPSTCERTSIPIPSDRSEKRATLVGGIAADGVGLKPLIILPRKTIAKELEIMGYTEDKYMFVHQENGFITKARFQEWILKILIPYFERRRQETGYAGRALLLLDGCRCHKTDEIAAELQRANIELLIIPAHSSHMIQALDLGIFGVFKLFKKKRLAIKLYEHQTGQVIKMCDAWQRATIPRNVVGAFRRAGLVAMPVPGRDHVYFLTFREEEAKVLKEYFPDDQIIEDEALASAGGRYYPNRDPSWPSATQRVRLC
jgi:hypothetical protein